MARDHEAQTRRSISLNLRRRQLARFDIVLFGVSFVVKVMSHAVATLKHKLDAMLSEKPIVMLCCCLALV